MQLRDRRNSPGAVESEPLHRGCTSKSNRSGLMENAEFKIKSLAEPLKNPCYIPSYTFFLDYQGDVLMCPHDWGKKIILGNLNKTNLTDIWFSKKSMQIRKMLNKSNRNFTPCNVCDVEGTLIGNEQSKAWDKIIEQK